MKSLSTILLMSSMALTSVAIADVKPSLLGPITHERTDTPKKVNANVGRFLYVGTAPKFDVGEVDLTVSKMSLTVRANGWMTQAKVDGYASQLYKRWEQIETTLQDPSFVLHPLVKFQNIATKDTSIA